MNCPYCGKEMQSGKLVFSSRVSLAEILWKADDKKYNFLDHLFQMDGVPVQGLDESFWGQKLGARHCSDCKKFIIDGWVETFEQSSGK